jgi:aldehyde:ferredoxin oxidoreductase
MTGPLTGTPALLSGRFTVIGKSPLTGTWGDANCGGDFGPFLKFAGYDGVFLAGTSSSPVYLFIENGKPELRDSMSIWGKDCLDTEDILKDIHGPNTSVACIGPAGEKVTLMATVIHQKGRAAGRSGMGALMGSKKLKALAVRGDMKVPIADEAGAKQLRRKWITQLSNFGEIVRKYGMAGVTESSAIAGDSPVRNWTGSYPKDFSTAKAISGETVIAEQERKYSCWQCPIGCGGLMKAASGRASVCHKPEEQTLAMSGTLCLNDDLESIIRVNDICNAYGLDTISVGSTIAFAIECYQNGILTKADTGRELRWADGETVVALAKQIARREGIGDLLADGVMRAAKKLGKGAEQFAVHVHGQEIPSHDPKFTPSLAVTYRMDATPGRHTQGGRGWLMGVDLLKDTVKDKYDYTNTGQIHKQASNMIHVVNAAGICLVAYMSYPAQFITDFLTAVTGLEYSFDRCFNIGERIANTRHMFNLREGLNPLKYYFNQRALGRPSLKKGPLANVTLDDDTMIRDYLKAMDWDLDTTKPSVRKLKELGLDQLVGDL